MSSAAARVLYVQYATPGAYPPVAHGAHILAEAGATVRMVGTRPPVERWIDMRPHDRIAVTLIREGEGMMQKVSYLRFVLATLWAVARFRPTWIYVSDLFGTPAGLAASMLSRAPILYHEHDVHTEASPSIFVRLCMKARRRVARHARCTVAPAPGRARLLMDALGVQSTKIVLNCPRRADVRANVSPRDDTLRLVYQGTIVPLRLPWELADAIATFRGAVTLAIAGYEPIGAIGHTASLLARVAEQGAPGAISYAGLYPVREQLLDFCAGYDVGLALVPPRDGDVNMHTMAGASNKAFDYLACGLPLMVTGIADWQQMFVAPGYAHAVHSYDTSAFIAALEWLRTHRAELGAMGSAGQRRVLEEWNYERQFEPIKQLLTAETDDASQATRAAA